MDRVWATTTWDDRDRTAGHSTEEFALASRADALARSRAAVESQAGPVLVTGEPGVGKSWLWRRLRDVMPAPWRWAGVDVSPAIDPAEFYRLIGHGLGLAGSDRPGVSRPALADFLLDGAADGTAWVLAVDEAHLASADVLEEIRVLANRLGRPGGFAGLVLVGQTALGRRIATGHLSALAARLSGRVHLKPLDADEARALVDHAVPVGTWDDATLERHHRDAAGNPRRLVQWAREAAARAARGRQAMPAATIEPQPPAPVEPGPRRGPSWDSPPLMPVRPPIRMEEGLIEVGWEPDAVPGPGNEAEGKTSLASVTIAPAAAVRSVPASEETIDDHYAALQAWTEWSRHQDRATSARADGPVEAGDSGGEAEGETSPIPNHPGVWAEGQHGFAPYSEMFSRLRHPRDVK